ncbi:MAG: bifunctional 3,4-dihydroxy-2-butanone-4-phosphate synthase/GTP cyclohydrolase II [Gammaproteobacteria bacterium]|nr:bifunctional 3,4-dihydroxy-2-butanone-4-phosphate synthase/GTP cyclohydrolase II [Gammaproteobacteria bacterium]MDH3561410.1 bifunctional 3,4-dihydroxy-2-butanone-4-phosphate synthase/GTP cyclohydrolase II [Gammaproteobacteria bacterium]
MPLNTAEELIEDIRAGRMVILMDDEDRENEGDLVMAATHVRPEDINFMASHGRGLICLTVTRERCRRLDLPLMVQGNESMHSTNFTISIEAAEGVTTGISAHDRARTIQAAVGPDAGPRDIVQPGHIFPLMAQPGGVLTRAGHTEAGCDLARLAGLEPAAVIVEILREDGSMARRPDLEIYAQEHGLKMGTIEDLIRYRIENETTVERVTSCELATAHGVFTLHAYRDTVDDAVHLALVKGDIRPDEPTLVRVHLENTLSDLVDAKMQDHHWPLRSALKRISREGKGVVVILRWDNGADALINSIRAYHMPETPQRVRATKEPQELRTFGVGAQIIADLGVKKMRVLSAPKIVHGIAGFGLEVVEYVDCY